MDGQGENNIINTSSDTVFNKKEDFQDADFADDKIYCESTITKHYAYVKLEEIEQYQISTTLDNIKTEIPLSERHSDIIDNDVKMEKEITVDDTKVEFDNELLCESCHGYCQDFCTECGMLVHILNKSATDKTNNPTRSGLPDNVLEIRESFGEFGIFALRVIPKDVKFGPFTGLSSSESIWKLKEGKFVVSENKLKHLNWMQHINPARSICEENLLPLQRDGNLYYQSTREIHEGEELLVYFGKEYEESLNKNVEVNFVPITEQDVKDVFACTFCCLGFSSRSYLTKHKSFCLNHAGEKFFNEELVQCPFCNFYLCEQEYYKYHMAYCSEGNVRKSTLLEPDHHTIEVKTDRRRLQTYKCTHCKYKTSYKGDLKSHANQHYEVKRYKCETCSKRFKTRNYLKIHEVKIHIYNYNCKICDYKTSNRSLFEMHKKKKHLKEFDYNCDTCDFKTNGKTHLEIHVKTAHLKEFDYNCETCDYKTNNRTNLEKHRKSKHLKEFEYNCDTCDFKTNGKTHLEIHVKTAHLKEFDYNCEICNYKANNRSLFEMHIKTKHLKEFDYICKVCDYKTNRRSHFKVHEKTKHLNKFDYNCEACDFKTNARSYLEKHVKSKHLKEFDYNCEKCDYRTNIRINFKRHTERCLS